jgi:hypothetical protein
MEEITVCLLQERREVEDLVKKKKRKEDPSIFVDGKPLNQHLADQEQEEQDQAMMEHINGEVITHRRNIPPQTSKQYQDRTITARGSSRVASRVRRLSKEEIEKEYGPMTKPNKMKLLLGALKTQGSLTSDQAANATGYTRRTAGTTLWRLMKVWPDGMEVDRTESPVVYTLKSNVRRKTINQLYEEYRAYCRTQYNIAKLKKEADKKPDLPTAEEAIEPEPSTITPTAIVGIVKDPDAVEDHNININVNITVHFKWGD